MTAYREGQRVRIEYPDGTLVEGVVGGPPHTAIWFANNSKAVAIRDDGSHTTTVLPDPRPNEPKGTGAVVYGSHSSTDRCLFVRMDRRRGSQSYRADLAPWVCDHGVWWSWDSIGDLIEVLAEGWTMP